MRTGLQKKDFKRKYGGRRRKIAQYLERLEKFPIIKGNDSENLQNFADLLDIAVINIKEVGIESELENGTMYMLLQRKLPKEMLAKYHRWIFENKKQESVETLKEYIVQEAEFQTIASETIYGLGTTPKTQGQSPVSRTPRPKDRAYFTGVKTMNCRICMGKHGVWACEAFKQLAESERWVKAKEAKLCFRCLSESHVGMNCPRGRVC